MLDGLRKRWGLWGVAIGIPLWLAWELAKEWLLNMISAAISEWFGLPDFSLQQSWPLAVNYGIPAALVGLSLYVAYLAFRTGRAKTPAPAAIVNRAGPIEHVAAAPTVLPPPEPDIWLAVAINYAATGVYGTLDIDMSGPGIGQANMNRLGDVAKQVRQFAFNGRLPVWGKCDGNDLERPIPSEFWEYGQLDFLSLFIGDPAQLRTEKAQVVRALQTWTGLRTHRTTVEQLWPPQPGTTSENTATGNPGITFNTTINNDNSKTIHLHYHFDKIGKYEQTTKERKSTFIRFRLDGTATIEDAENITAIVDHGEGLFSIEFATPLNPKTLVVHAIAPASNNFRVEQVRADSVVVVFEGEPPIIALRFDD